MKPDWTPTSRTTLPQPGELHVWSVPLEISVRRQEQLASLLADDERTRAGRFLFDDDRRRFVACRGRLRKILASYLAKPPAEISFSYSGLGKPSLANPHQPPLYFNVSHSGELALVAVSLEGELGADVERRRDVRDMHGLATRFFSQEESSGLFRLPAADQPPAFFRIWTRKEAILKATGKGLTYPLDRLTVSFREEEPAALLSLGEDPQEASHWTLYHLAPAPEYEAAVAMRYQPTSTLFYQWLDDDLDLERD